MGVGVEVTMRESVGRRKSNAAAVAVERTRPVAASRHIDLAALATVVAQSRSAVWRSGSIIREY